MQARERIRSLDLDLAAMRSVSPSFAVTRQVDREMAQIERDQGDWLKHLAVKFNIPWPGR